MRTMDVSVMTVAQVPALADHLSLIDRVYVDEMLAFANDDTLRVPDGLSGKECFLALPRMTRQEEGAKDMEDLEAVRTGATEAGFAGVLLRNLEQAAYFLEKGFSGRLVADAALYAWNHRAVRMLTGELSGGIGISEITMPYELSLAQFQQVTGALRRTEAGDAGADTPPFSVVIYGHTPMMISAGCLRQTLTSCTGKRGERVREQMTITDRTGRTLPVTVDCRCCYNVIGNAHPLSLHKYMDRVFALGDPLRVRLDFTVEDGGQCGEVLVFFEKVLSGDGDAKAPFEAHTVGRGMKGVE